MISEIEASPAAGFDGDSGSSDDEESVSSNGESFLIEHGVGGVGEKGIQFDIPETRM